MQEKQKQLNPLSYEIKINNNNYLFTNTSIYIPQINDKIIGRVFYCGSEYYKLDLFNNSLHIAVLNILSFKNATKKMRPKIEMNDILICNIEEIGELEIIVSCNNEYLGILPLFKLNNEIKEEEINGFLLQIKPSKCKQLYFSNTLIEISKEFNYEIYIGLNGIIWINCNKRDIKKIGNYILSPYF